MMARAFFELQRLVWIVVAIAVLASGEARADVHATSVAALVEAYRDAYDSGNMQRAMDLFYWRGVDPRQRTHLKQLVRRDLASRVAKLDVLDADRGPTEFLENGVMNRANLPVVGHLLAEFVGNTGARHYSLHMIGEKDGVYYIALAVPEA